VAGAALVVVRVRGGRKKRRAEAGDPLAYVEQTVKADAKEAEGYGTLLDGHLADRRDIFEDVFAEMPAHLRRQRDEMERLA